MRTLLHIGMAKTGSTALQQSLLRSHDALTARGVFYPQNPPGVGFVNHKLIVAGLVEYDRLPRHLRGNSPQRLARQSAGFLRDARRAIAATAPRCVILSTESFFRVLSEPERARLPELLEGLLGETRVVAYLRPPSEHYVSGLQQSLKGSFRVSPPKQPKWRRVLEAYAAIFGAAALSLNLYNRARLAEGDIVADFAGRYLASYGVARADLATPDRTNPSLSAESVDVSRRFRLAFHRDRDNRRTEDSNTLVRALRTADAATGAPRPRLRPGIAERIDYAWPDPLWLRDRHGIEFPDFDYRRLEAGGGTKPPKGELALEDILEIDRARERAILAELRAAPWTAAAPERAAWIDALLAELA